VRALLEDERAWIKGTDAVDANDNQVAGWNSRAVRWCLLGACDTEARPIPVINFLSRILDTHPAFAPLGYARIVEFNDAEETTHADVLRLIDVAIEQAELGASESS
jgi:hypothetical protein